MEREKRFATVDAEWSGGERECTEVGAGAGKTVGKRRGAPVRRTETTERPQRDARETATNARGTDQRAAGRYARSHSARFHYTDPTRPDQIRVSDKVRGLCQVASGPVGPV